LSSGNDENPRKEIEEAIDVADLPRLLRISGMLHGHYCAFSALGVKAAALAMKKLRAASTGMEEVVAIVETNNCFSDGVQIVTGCSFGNNALIYKDFGKTAFTLAKRNGEGIRIYVKADRVMQEQSPEARELFQKVVVQRSGSKQEGKRLGELGRELSFRMLELPDEEVFDIKRVTVDVPAYAPIFASARCSVCGENIMETRVGIKEGLPICLACSDRHEYYQLAGDGISAML
jgi:formylmethanofuran dehydrogenase subunit E